MNRQVNLTKRVKTPQGLRFCPAVISANGRVKPDWIIVAAKEERHPEGAYYLEWYDGRRRVRLSVGKDAVTAAARRHRQEQVLASKAVGIKLAEERSGNGPLLAITVAIYLDEIKSTKKPKTYAAYSTALAYFLECCPPGPSIQKLIGQTSSGSVRSCSKTEPRTVYNKFESVMSFLKSNEIRGLTAK